ncbi:hypothetical protein VTP01DRAFT_6984 [Rhizomucor pusillus]|uniref:uncharacterized protein n=1 Tax=Rhizomucor pusillus TaxID=4840 RepID=UPI003742B3BF
MLLSLRLAADGLNVAVSEGTAKFPVNPFDLKSFRNVIKILYNSKWQQNRSSKTRAVLPRYVESSTQGQAEQDPRNN